MAKKSTVRTVDCARQLQVKLTSKQIEERGRLAANTLAERDKAELEAKADAKANKLAIDGLEAEFRQLCAEVRQGYKYEEVPCRREFDFSAKTVTDVRLDTGEIVDSRGMSREELQSVLDFGPPSPLESEADEEGQKLASRKPRGNLRVCKPDGEPVQ